MIEIVSLGAIQGFLLAYFWWAKNQTMIAFWTSLAALQLALVALHATPIIHWPPFSWIMFINIDLLYGPILLAWLASSQKKSFVWWPHALMIVAIHAVAAIELMLSAAGMPLSRWLTALHVLAYVLYAIHQHKAIWVPWQRLFLLTLLAMWTLALATANLPPTTTTWIMLSFMPVTIWIFGWGWLFAFKPELMRESTQKYQRQTLPSSTNELLLQELLRAIELGEYRQWQSRSHVANALGISPEQLSCWLSQYVGCSLAELFALVRSLDVAQQLQLGSREPLLILAMDAGFGNKVSFNQAFKKTFGCTPSTFRVWSKTEQELAITRVKTVNILGINAITALFTQHSSSAPLTMEAVS